MTANTNLSISHNESAEQRQPKAVAPPNSTRDSGETQASQAKYMPVSSPKSEVTLYKWAVQLWRMGFNVIPLASDKGPVIVATGTGKRLRWKHWQTDRQTEAQVSRLPWPKATGLGVVCGEISRGLVCLDFDKQPNDQALQTALKLLGLPMDYPWVVKTPGGGQHVYVLVADTELNVTSQDQEGKTGGHIELRYNRRLATLPPSQHPKGGHYRFASGTFPAELPATVSSSTLLAAYDAITKKKPSENAVNNKSQTRAAVRHRDNEKAYAQAALEKELAALSQASEGHRNRQLNRSTFALGQLVGGGYLERGEVESVLTSKALAIGLSEPEIRSTLESGLEAGIAKPRTVPELHSRRKGRRSRTSDTFTQSDRSVNEDTKLPPPTDDEFGDMLMADWDGNIAFFHEVWHKYQDGYWAQVPASYVRSMVWRALKERKDRGTRPSISRRNSILGYLEDHLAVPDDLIDLGDEYINLQNGLFNLETGKSEEHQRDLYLTSQLGFAHDPDADCPLWKQSLAQWLTTADGQPEGDLIALLQEAFGYSLTTDTSFQAAFWLYGPAGSGKSTVLQVLSALGGNSQLSLDLSSLDRNPYQLADLPGKRIVTCTEARAGSALADDKLKNIISGEEVVARRLYGQTFRFKPQAKVWWAMNERPTNRDSSDAIYRRLVNILFPNVIQPEARNRRLFEQLLAELPGIFNWAMEGLQRLHADGHFTKSAQAEQSLEEYRLENDIERAFLQDTDWCILDPSQQTKSVDLYLAYKAWCQRFGHIPFKSQAKVARDWDRL